MKERNERIERLLGRYFEAQTTDAEERELRAYFRHTKQLPDSLRYAETMFGGLEELAGEQLPAKRRTTGTVRGAGRSVGVRRADGGRTHAGRRMQPLWGVAVAAALAIGIFIYAGYLRKPYCYIDGVAVYDKEMAMQTTVYLKSLSALDESSRMVDELIRNN